MKAHPTALQTVRAFHRSYKAAIERGDLGILLSLAARPPMYPEQTYAIIRVSGMLARRYIRLGARVAAWPFHVDKFEFDGIEVMGVLSEEQTWLRRVVPKSEYTPQLGKTGITLGLEWDEPKRASLSDF